MRKKILLVEDNARLLELLRLNLKAAGFSIATASDGIEALNKARSLLPDLIVLDLVLPELDGFVVCESLRKSAATAAIPVIMLSGLCGQFTRLAGLESGGTDFLSKPASPKDLIAKIKALLSGAEPIAK
jgi:two-component system alkaline phosphatase synthesis response regulator PhoP